MSPRRRHRRPRVGCSSSMPRRSPTRMGSAIAGSGVDIRALGGYVVLPQPGNGREWLRPLIGGPIASASADVARCRAARSSSAAPLVLAPTGRDRSVFVRSLCAEEWHSPQLAPACAKIITAPCRAARRHPSRQCFYIGGLIGRGDLGYATAYAALYEAACAIAGLSRAVAQPRRARRPLARGRHQPSARNLRGRAVDAQFSRQHALQAVDDTRSAMAMSSKPLPAASPAAPAALSARRRRPVAPPSTSASNLYLMYRCTKGGRPRARRFSKPHHRA